MKDLENELERYSELSKKCEAKGISLHDFFLGQIVESLWRIEDMIESQEDRDTFRMFHGK